jgi:trans-2,3-dihydro-3-hydroxyanthranilate isomerase
VATVDRWTDDMPPHPLHIVDVFAEEKYAGNQLAVVTAAADLDTARMQRIAREMNFSETAFVLSDAPRNGGYDVRIFTPMAEVPFAGHPTLGTAFVIRHALQAPPADMVTLHLGIGAVPVRFEATGGGAPVLWMSPPPPALGAVHRAAEIAPLLNLSVDDIDPRFPVQTASIGIAFTMVPVRTLAAIKRAREDVAAAQKAAGGGWPSAFFLFAPETYHATNQVNVRMFAGSHGVAEDPATGSANACLGAYLVQHRYFGTTSADIRVEQGYEIGRPSLLFVRAAPASGGPRVQVGGRVFVSARGELV